MQNSREDCTNSTWKHLKISDGWWTSAKMKEDDYMAISPIWAELKDERKKIDGWKCIKCGSPYNLQIHHESYPAAWGEETLDDLKTFCAKHHAEVHSK